MRRLLVLWPCSPPARPWLIVLRPRTESRSCLSKYSARVEDAYSEGFSDTVEPRFPATCVMTSESPWVQKARAC